MDKIITVKADIHPDGDIYIYNKKDKKFHYVGMVVNNMKEFIIDNKILYLLQFQMMYI